MMFDGMLPRDEDEPEMIASPAPSGWPWELTALLLTMTVLSVLAAVFYPDLLAYPGTRF
jgi:hypothetical protein